MQTSKYQIKTNKAIDPFTIALVTDLHGKPYKSVIKSLNTFQPDYIAIVGDVVNGDNDTYPLEFFRLCAGIAQSFFSLEITRGRLRKNK